MPESAYTFTTTSAQGAQTLGNVEQIITANAGDYIQFYWQAAATGMALTPTSAGTNPTRPASPSVNLNIFNVGECHLSQKRKKAICIYICLRWRANGKKKHQRVNYLKR